MEKRAMIDQIFNATCNSSSILLRIGPGPSEEGVLIADNFACDLFALAAIRRMILVDLGVEQ